MHPYMHTYTSIHYIYLHAYIYSHIYTRMHAYMHTHTYYIIIKSASVVIDNNHRLFRNIFERYSADTMFMLWIIYIAGYLYIYLLLYKQKIVFSYTKILYTINYILFFCIETQSTEQSRLHSQIMKTNNSKQQQQKNNQLHIVTNYDV